MADNSLQPRVATFGHYITERPSPGRFHFKTCVTPEGRPRGGPENLGMYREITALEMIHRQGPLPSVSQYHGCIIINGEIVGVCKDRIAHTLPSALESQLIPDINWFIQQVRHGIDAIHSFGFAHNAICGENIMVTENGQPRITNFTSALPLGQYLPNFSQVDSHGAHRISRYATPSRDHCALQALQDYLIEHQARR
ncbi:hypothetical protein IWQ60_011387 [Tieghemiomyces parasiticus]|uniref:Protein kinase domain-containing protein n=1 Tax=Tieghemiomyces parasiticus TaxID=78921 RepID=A0A9W7ZNC5_9FUNG|nr:hypothetical protein IWQ60_011387 [Tieghemiomyces parasiticus]